MAEPCLIDPAYFDNIPDCEDKINEIVNEYIPKDLSVWTCYGICDYQINLDHCFPTAYKYEDLLCDEPEALRSVLQRYFGKLSEVDYDGQYLTITKE